MTCIAAINKKDNDHIEYGADTLCTSGYLEFEIKTKIIKRNGYIVLPTWSASGAADILDEIMECLDDCIKNGKELKKELPKRYARLKKENFAFHGSDQTKGGYSFTLLLIFPFGIFTMYSGQCTPYKIENEYVTEGSGKEVCYGALLTNKVTLKEALEISRMSVGVGGKIQTGAMKKRDATTNEKKALSSVGLVI